MLAVNQIKTYTNRRENRGNLFQSQEFTYFKKLAFKFVLLRVHKRAKPTRKQINRKGRLLQTNSKGGHLIMTGKGLPGFALPYQGHILMGDFSRYIDACRRRSYRLKGHHFYYRKH